MNQTIKNELIIFLTLTKRHLLLFFKNKMRVFYTLLVPIIILGVYVFFLRDLELSNILGSIDELLKDSELNANDHNVIKYIETIIDSWMLSGIISLSTLTVSLQTNNIFVEDKENGTNRDFISSPIKKSTLISSYFLSNFIVTFTICFLVLLISLLYLLINGEFFINFGDFCLIFLTLIEAVMLSSLSMIFICIFIKKEATLSSLIAIFATAAGFLIGAYVPVSFLPNVAQNVCAFFPGTYSTGILRNVFSNTTFAHFEDYLSNHFNSNDALMIIANIKNSVGYNIRFFDIYIEVNFQSIIAIIFIVIFAILNIIFSNKMTSIQLGIKEIKKKNQG